MRYILILIFLFFGCSVKKPVLTSTYLITIKSKKFRFSDIGYVKKYDKYILLEIYSAGIALIKIKIDNRVCIDNYCIKKDRFNKEYLSKFYPKDLFKNIILGRPIFNSKNFIKNRDGFKQKIYKKNSFDIIYIVNSKKIYFKDRVNKILIKIERDI